MFGDTPLVMVEDQQSLQKLAEQLRDEPFVALDTESDSFHHFQEKVCLLQVSDRTTDFIIDPLKVPDLSVLAPIFANRDLRSGILSPFVGPDWIEASIPDKWDAEQLRGKGLTPWLFCQNEPSRVGFTSSANEMRPTTHNNASKGAAGGC